MSFLDFTRTGLIKNVLDHFSRCFGSREIEKAKVNTYFLNKCFHNAYFHDACNHATCFHRTNFLKPVIMRDISMINVSMVHLYMFHDVFIMLAIRASDTRLTSKLRTSLRLGRWTGSPPCVCCP